MRSRLSVFRLPMMVAFLCSLGCVGYAQAPPAEIQMPKAAFPAGKSVVEVPFEVERNWVVIPVSINNSRPLRFVLDTGAAGAFLNNAALADQLNLTTSGTTEVRGAGGGPNPTFSIAKNVTFNIAGVEFRDGTLLVRKPSSGPSMPSPSDGVIGRPIFAGLVVELDWVKKVLKLYPANYRHNGKGAVLPLTFDEGGRPYTTANVVIEGDIAIPVKLVVDTGASASALWLDLGSKPEIKLPKTSISAVLGRGASGEVRGYIGRVKSIKLGDYQLTDVLASFRDASSGTFGLAGRQGGLGAELLGRFKVIFDYSREQMILEPNTNFNDAFEFTMSGLGFMPMRPGAGGLRVAQVYDNSPAKEAGLMAGDEIVAINGREISEFKPDEVLQIFRMDKGKEITLTVMRGKDQFEKKLKLRRFI
jgi:predicted aspartyl protease